ncbi:MAG: hypothetical protein ACKO23_20055, partial [Gemmataceae bacterium]
MILDAEPLSVGPATAPPTDIPPVPPRNLAAILSGFMEQRNILWGELVGGTLIVGCSIALVLSLWQQLQALPYFPFLLFSTLTGSLFLAGSYTLHHWKLTSTSRGLMLISLCLVPLNLLILADPMARGASLSPWTDGLAAIIALAGSGFLVFRAGRILQLSAGEDRGSWGPGWLTLGVVGAAGSQLLVPLGLISPESLAAPATGWTLLLGLAMLCYLVATLFRVIPNQPASDSSSGAFSAWEGIFRLSFLGLVFFSLAATMAFLLTRLENPADGIKPLSTALVLAGIPPLLVGLLLPSRLEDADLSRCRTFSLAVALAAILVLFIGIVLSLPYSPFLLANLLLSGLALASLAMMGKLDWPLMVASPLLSAGGILVYHLLAGHWNDGPDSAAMPPWKQMTAPESGLLLSVFASLIGMASWGIRMRGRSGAARDLGRSGMGVGIAGLALSTWYGLAHPDLAVWSHGIASVALFLASFSWNRWYLVTGSGLLMLLGTTWGLRAWAPDDPLLWGLVFAMESLILIAMAHGFRRGGAKTQSDGLKWSSLGAVVAGTGCSFFTPHFPFDSTLSLTGLVLTLSMLGQYALSPSAGLFMGFQGFLTATTLCGASYLSRRWGWVDDIRWPQACLFGLTLLSLVWEGVRASLPRHVPRLKPTSLDRVTLWLSLIVVFGFSLIGSGHSILTEWGLESPIRDASFLRYLAGTMAWSSLGMLMLAYCLQLMQPMAAIGTEERAWAVSGFWMVLGCVPLVGSIGANEEFAGASTARWGLAMTYLLGLAILWVRPWLASAASHLRLEPVDATPRSYFHQNMIAVAVISLTAVLTFLGF